MRSVIGTAPAMFGSSALAAGGAFCPAALAGPSPVHAPITIADAVPPVV
jgi:hypothetical protein